MHAIDDVTSTTSRDCIWHGDYAAVPASLRDAIEAECDPSRMVGLVLGLCFNGHSSFATCGTGSIESRTPIALDCRFDLSCLVKVVGSALVLDLCERGLLDIDETIDAYLEEFAGTEKGGRITISNLLSHTAGFLAVNTPQVLRPPPDRQSLYRYILESPQLFSPGSVFSYQNTCSVLLSDIVERVSGHSVPDLINARLINARGHGADTTAETLPAGGVQRAVGHAWSRKHERFVKCEQLLAIDSLWQPAVNTRIRVSIPELLSLAELMTGLPQEPGAPGHGMSSSAMSAMRTCMVSIPRGSDRAASGLVPAHFCRGIGRYSRGLLGHDGTLPGQNVGMRLIPERHTCVVVAGNFGNGAIRQRIFDCVADALSLEDPMAAPVSDCPFSTEELAGCYVGRENLRITAAIEGEEILLTIDYGGRALIRMVGAMDRTGHFIARLSNSVRSELSDRMCYTFFADPITGEACLMMGVTALKRISR
jgi:hypothetical protein